MDEVSKLRRLVGITAADEALIANQRQQLTEQAPGLERELEAWLQTGEDRAARQARIHQGFVASFFSGEYQHAFYATQYRQAVSWRRQGLALGLTLALLSKLRTRFVELGTQTHSADLAQALCRTVDLAQAIQSVVHHLDHTLEDLQTKSQRELRRVEHSCEHLLQHDGEGLVHAYVEHFRWKLRAYRLALGEPASEDPLPLSTDECALGRWLGAGGLDLVQEGERQPLLSAHERLHRLMAMAVEDAEQGRPQAVTEYLVDVEAASEEIADILREAITSRLDQLVRQDSLTELGNRRLFERDLARKAALCERTGYRLGLLFIDIDYFKAVNDHYGHAVGDEVLRQLAERLVAALRSSDGLYRWGGEEFATLVWPAEPPGLEAAGERMRRAVAGSPFETSAGPVRITISVGAAYLGEATGKAPESVLQAADQGLRRAKAGGRNRLAVHSS